MALQLQRKLRHKYVIHIPSKGQASDSTEKPMKKSLKYTGLSASNIRYLKDDGNNNTSSANHSALFADNNFMRKSPMLSDLHAKHPMKQHSFTMVVVLASMFLFVTIIVTAAIIVFCRKRNTVFALQKSEQEDDGEYELDELNTDIEYTETDIESECDSLSRRMSYPQEESSHRLLGKQMQDAQDTFHHTCHCQHGYACPCPASYQNMVVAAVLEKQPLCGHSDSEDCVVDIQKYHKKATTQQKGYHYGQLMNESDVESDHELMNNSSQNSQMGLSSEGGFGESKSSTNMTNQNNNCSTLSCDGNYKQQYDCESNTNVDVCANCGFHNNKRCTGNYKASPKKLDDSSSLYVTIPVLKSKSDAHLKYVDIHEEKSDKENSHGDSIVDLHPNNGQLVEDCSHDHYCNTTPTKLDYPIKSELPEGNTSPSPISNQLPTRSHSVTEHLSHLADSDADASGCEAISCPQTPLTEDPPSISINKDPMVYYSHTYATPLYRPCKKVSTVSSNSEQTPDNQTTSMVSLDQESGVGFVLCNPYSSSVSLSKDNYPYYMLPFSESSRNQHTSTKRGPSQLQSPTEGNLTFKNSNNSNAANESQGTEEAAVGLTYTQQQTELEEETSENGDAMNELLSSSHQKTTDQPRSFHCTEDAAE